MTLQSDMVTDLDVFLADFGQAATYTPASGAASSITCLFDNAYVPANLGGVEVETLGPAATCKTSDVSGAAHGDTLYVNSVTYNIIAVQPDGTGMTVLLLSKD